MTELLFVMNILLVFLTAGYAAYKGVTYISKLRFRFKIVEGDRDVI